jgi:Ca2+-binding RTX toxin-like protein
MGRVAAISTMLGMLVAFPASAGAVTTASVSGSTLNIGGGNESNHVQIDQGGPNSELLVSDPGGVSSGAVCSPDSSTEARCGDSFTTAIVATLGNGFNSFKGKTGGILFSWDVLSSVRVTGGVDDDDLGPDGLHGARWTINGGAGDDTLTGSDENDVINGGVGEDDINARPGNDVVHGDADDDTITGYTDNDKVYGDAGDDNIDGDAGDDLIVGGPGRDKLHGEIDDSYSGDDTIEAVDGEQDTVSCGYGTDVVNADDIDVVGNQFDCEQVNRKTAKPAKTPKPKPKAYKKHCKTKNGKKHCTQPHALKGKTYKGKTTQGSKVATGLSSNGKFFVFHAKYLTFKCQDGETFDEQDVALTAGDKQRLAKNGTANVEIDYDPSDVTDEVIYVVAAFDGKHARGALVGNAKFGSHGSCTSGKVGWTAKT